MWSGSPQQDDRFDPVAQVLPIGLDIRRPGQMRRHPHDGNIRIRGKILHQIGHARFPSTWFWRRGVRLQGAGCDGPTRRFDPVGSGPEPRLGRILPTLHLPEIRGPIEFINDSRAVKNSLELSYITLPRCARILGKKMAIPGSNALVDR